MAGDDERGGTAADLPDPRPLRGYGALLGAYAGSCGLVAAVLANRRAKVHLSTRDVCLLALATAHLSRLLAKDSVLAPIRSPFTAFEEPAGEGEVHERVIGRGLKHAAGELITCPFCLAQWVATGLVTAWAAFPGPAEAIVSVAAIARVSDVIQLLYDRAKPD